MRKTCHIFYILNVSQWFVNATVWIDGLGACWCTDRFVLMGFILFVDRLLVP